MTDFILTPKDWNDAERGLTEALDSGDTKRIAAAGAIAARWIVRHLRSLPPPHPAPPPSPSEENGGEIRDSFDRHEDETIRQLVGTHGTDHNLAIAHAVKEGRALGNAEGKKHQASADEATIAGLRRVRPAVAWFAEQMEAKLRENDHKGGWSECTVGYLVERLREETVELEMALDAKPFDVVVREAADVANFAMMLADLCAPKPPTPTTEKD